MSDIKNVTEIVGGEFTNLKDIKFNREYLIYISGGEGKKHWAIEIVNDEPVIVGNMTVREAANTLKNNPVTSAGACEVAQTDNARLREALEFAYDSSVPSDNQSLIYISGKAYKKIEEALSATKTRKI